MRALALYLETRRAVLAWWRARHDAYAARRARRTHLRRLERIYG